MRRCYHNKYQSASLLTLLTLNSFIPFLRLRQLTTEFKLLPFFHQNRLKILKKNEQNGEAKTEKQRTFF